MALIKNHKEMHRFTDMYWHRNQGIEAVSKVSKKNWLILRFRDSEAIHLW